MEREYSKKAKHIIWIAVTAAILIFLSLAFIWVPKRYDATYTGIRWQSENPGYTEKVDVTVKGTVYSHMLAKSKFVGQIDIEGIEQIEDCKLVEFSFVSKEFYDYGFLIYANPDETKREVKLGTLGTQGEMDEFVIFLDKDIAGVQQRITVANGIETREDAIEATRRICGEIFGLS